MENTTIEFMDALNQKGDSTVTDEPSTLEIE